MKSKACWDDDMRHVCIWILSIVYNTKIASAGLHPDSPIRLDFLVPFDVFTELEINFIATVEPHVFFLLLVLDAHCSVVPCDSSTIGCTYLTSVI